MTERTSVSITNFGAKGDGKTDNRAAIQKAVDHAKAQGLDVYVPEGLFLHKGIITLNGVDMVGAGANSVLKAVGASATFDDQAIKLTGTGASLRHLTLDSDATTRASSGESAKVWVAGATDFSIEGIRILNAHSAGILVVGKSSHGTILNNHISGTNADSIHMSQASHHILVKGNTIKNSHDDGIAVVSYARNGAMVSDIQILDNTIVNNEWGRNISVVGGQNVTIKYNTVDGNLSGAAGVYIAAEPNYDTFGVKNVVVSDNVIKNTGGTNTGHGAVMIYNGTSGRMVEDVVVHHNEIVNAKKNGVMIRGSRIDDITLSQNLIEKSAAAPVAVSGSPTDLIQTGNTTTRAGWPPIIEPGGNTPSTPAIEPAPMPRPVQPQPLEPAPDEPPPASAPSPIPNPILDHAGEARYLASNPDVKAAIADGLLNSGLEHYLSFGAAEGRGPYHLFDESWYLNTYPDVAQAVAAGWYADAHEHYSRFGWSELRNPSSLMDVARYLADYPDVAEAGIDPMGHFINHGVLEGRTIVAVGIDDDIG